MRKVLTIAGSDSCGGAGIQADLKTMSAIGVYGMSVITAVTAQNTMGVFAIQDIAKEVIEKQIEVVYSDIEVSSVKVGMLSSCDIIDSVEKKLLECKAKNIVLDPVIFSKSNFKLLQDDAVERLRKFLKIGDIVTPNIPEAEILSEMKIKDKKDMILAGRKIKELGVKNVLIKGGNRMEDCLDIFINEVGKVIELQGERIITNNTHGTGCPLSSAIASYMGKGYTIEESVKYGKEYITQAIKNSLTIGHGVGPVGHLVELYKKAGINYE